MPIPATVPAAPFTPQTVLYVERRDVRWWVSRAVIATVVAIVAYPVDAERGHADWWEIIRVIVTAASFIVASRLWLGLIAVERGSDEWMDAPRRWQTSRAVIEWAQDRYGDVAGLAELRRHRRRLHGPRHERVIWHAAAWVPSERAGGEGWHRREVELRFDADGTPRLIDVHYSTPEQELPLAMATGERA